MAGVGSSSSVFVEAYSAFEAANQKQRIHPTDDFARCIPLFNRWRSENCRDQRPLNTLLVSEARSLFATFALRFNTMTLPIDFYGVAAIKAPETSSNVTRRVYTTTHLMRWSDLARQIQPHPRH